MAQNSFVRFATGQLHPTDAVIKNNGNIPREINTKHLEHTLASYFFSLGNQKEGLQPPCYPFHYCLARQKFANEAGAHQSETAEPISN